MRKRIGIFGLTEEVRQLIPLLVANPNVEIAGVFDPNPDATGTLSPEIEATVEPRRVNDPSLLGDDRSLYAVVDGGIGEESFLSIVQGADERGLQIVSPLTARLLWGYGAPAMDRKADLLQTLHEVVESYNLTIDTDELFGQMLEIARSATGADGGSLMLLDSSAQKSVLGIRVAVGIEPELWTKIRVPVGEGIAGRVAADARPLLLRGKADRQAFHILHERQDIASAISVPLVSQGRVLGVLNLHHSTESDAFSDEDLDFANQLAILDAQIIARAQEHARLRDQAARFAAVREVQNIVANRDTLSTRLTQLCRFAAQRVDNGIANLYLLERGEDDLRLAATSRGGGEFVGEYVIALGAGVDGSVAQTREAVFLRRAGGNIAYAALPLIAGETLIGVLSIQASPESAQSGQAALRRGRAAEEILLEIAAAAAEGIASVRREASVTARATKIGAINETGIRMISVTDLSEVLRLGASGAAMVLEADHSVLRVRDEQTGRFVIRSYFGSASGPLQEQLFRLDKQICVDTIKRRAPKLICDLHTQGDRVADEVGVKSVIAAPLMHEGSVIGALALYDKVAPDRFSTASFHEEDLELFGKFAKYLERAITSALTHARTRRFRNFDEETGVPNTAYLDKRIREEITRSNGRADALAIAICRIENLDAIESAANAEKSRGVVQCTVDALRPHIRAFDVVGRTGHSEFTVLLPDPGRDPAERIFALAHAVADAVARNEAVNQPERVAIAFGYAVYPSDGDEREALFERARVPRIRMV